MGSYKYIDAKGRTRYRVQVEFGTLPDGTRDRKTKVCNTEREAKKVDAQFNLEKERLNGHSNRITFRELVEDYYLPETIPLVRENTMAMYERDIRLRLMPAFGKMLIGDIGHAQIQRMISSCATHKIATNARDTLRTILRFAYDNEMLVKNPARAKFRFPEKIMTKDESGRKDRVNEWVTNFAEQKRIIELIDDPLTKRLLVLGFCFGLRKGEIPGLNWDDVDFESREISIRRTVTFTKVKLSVTPPKTEESRRRIPMSDYAYGCLKAFYKEDCRQSKVVDKSGKHIAKGPIVQRRGNYLSPKSFDTAFAVMRKKYDIPWVTPGNMRHSFATAAIRAGMDVTSLKKIMGHAQIETTYRYVRLMQSDLHEDMRLVSDAYKTA